MKVLAASQVGPRSSAFALCCDRSGRAQDLGGHQWDQGGGGDVGLGTFSWVETRQRWLKNGAGGVLQEGWRRPWTNGQEMAWYGRVEVGCTGGREQGAIEGWAQEWVGIEE